MNERFRALALLLSASSLAVACSSPGGDSQANPTSPEEALKAIPEENRQVFELWKRQILKSCDASEALMTGAQDSSTSKFVDVGAAIERLGHTAMVTQGNSRFAILGSPEEPSGLRESSFEFSVDAGGKKSQIKASTKAIGSKCEVFLFGQKVHETRIANRLSVAAAWAAGREPQPSQAVDVRPSQRPSAGSNYTFYNGYGMVEGVMIALRPEISDAEFVGGKLGFSAEQSRQLIQFTSPQNLSATFELIGEREFLAFTPEAADVYGPRYRVESIVTQAIPPRLRLRMKQNWMLVNANADRQGPMMIEAQLLTRPSANGFRAFQAQTLNVVASEPYNDSTAAACFQQRLNVLFDARLSTSYYALEPSPGAVTYGCAGYVLDIDEVIYQRPETRAAVAQFLTRMVPNRNGSSNGWDRQLIQWAARAQREGKPLRETLDPNGVRPQVYEAGLIQADTLIAEAAPFPNLANDKETLVRVGYTWATRGENVPRQRLVQIFVGVNNIAAELPSLAQNLWNTLVNDPYGSDEQLMYASSLNQQDKQNLIAVMNAATALELDAWRSANLSNLLETRPSRETIALWKSQLDAAAEFSTRDQARVKSGYEFMHKGRKRDFIAKAMSEGWTAETYAAAEALSRVGHFNMSCRNYQDTTLIADCANEQMYSVKGLLNPAYNGRYVRLATQLDQKLTPHLGDISASSFVDTIADEFFRLMWANCDAVGFESRANTLLTTLSQWARETEWFRKTEHERAIRDQLRQSCR